jgi:hypothetical protein
MALQSPDYVFICHSRALYSLLLQNGKCMRGILMGYRSDVIHHILKWVMKYCSGYGSVKIVPPRRHCWFLHSSCCHVFFWLQLPFTVSQTSNVWLPGSIELKSCSVISLLHRMVLLLCRAVSPAKWQRFSACYNYCSVTLQLFV